MSHRTPKLRKLAKAARAQSTPETRPLIENIIAHMERSPSYYSALGRFVSDFSRIETTLQRTLWIAAGVSDNVAPAVFSGLKVEGCLQFIKRIADAKGWKTSQSDLLEEITSRLGPINKLRNDILHYG